MNDNTSDDDNNPMLCSEPNVSTKNRFQTLENPSEDSCVKEQGAALGSVAILKEIDEEESSENEKSIERTRLINNEKNEVKKTFMSPEENAFLELLSIVLGT